MNGKGSRPRNNYSPQFRSNFDSIDWGKKDKQLFCPKGHELYFGKICYECNLEKGKCGCMKCNPHAWWMIVCDKCGNKRCPHATSHELGCTNSNAPGQKGSVFE